MDDTIIKISKREAKNGCVKIVYDKYAGRSISVNVPAGIKNGSSFFYPSVTLTHTLQIGVKVRSSFPGVIAKIFLILILLGSVAAYFDAQRATDGTRTSNILSDVFSNEPEEVSFVVNEHDYYNQLSDIDKRLYAAAYNACLNCEDKFSLIMSRAEYGNFVRNAGNSELRFIEALWFDHPELIQMTDSFSYEARSTALSTKRTVFVDMNILPYLSDASYCKSAMNDVKAEAQRIAGEITANNPDDYSRVLAAHDYLINTTDYDFYLLKVFTEQEQAENSGMIHTAQGALIHGRAVCDGYAKALKLILNDMGIDSIIVSTTDHAFNIVWINGEPTCIDACWDDNTKIEEDGSLNSENPYIRHEYFGMTSAEISSIDSHIIANSPFELPECTSDAFRYHKYMGQYAETYDFATVNELVTMQYYNGSKSIEILFGSNAELTRAVDDLTGANSRIWNISCLRGSRLSYYAGNDTNVLHIYIGS